MVSLRVFGDLGFSVVAVIRGRRCEILCVSVCVCACVGWER